MIETPSDDESRRNSNMDAIRRAMAAVNAGDDAGLLAEVADDVEYEAPYYDAFAPKHGRDELAAMLDAVRQRFSRVCYTIVRLHPTVDPDLVIAEMRGDNEVRGSDRSYRNHYIQFFTFTDGKISHWREFSNPDVYRTSTDDVGRA